MMPTRQRDAGFTLIESLIAMVIMAVAVLVVVGALGTLIITSQQHRGHAVTETTARSFGQAIQAKALGKTALVSALAANTSATSITVTTAADLVGVRYLSVDSETVEITGSSGNNLTVIRARNDPTSLAAHAAGASVVPIFRCLNPATPADVAQLTPRAGTWQSAAGLTAQISTIEWWDAASSSFSSDYGSGSSGCSSRYDEHCYFDDGTGGLEPDIRADCSAGIYRVGITVTTDARFRSVSTTTAVVVRRGSR